ncbi:MAG: PEP-CTERM sorting domain-containing protein [Methylophilaceae bacterium]
MKFSQTIANPVFAFVSLNGNGYAFNQDFELLSLGGVDGKACGYWGCGGASKVVVDLGGGNFEYQLNSNNIGGTEPHGALRFTGAFDTLTWKSASNEYWNGFTVGVQGTAAEVFPPSGVPEPGMLALLGLGLFSLVASRKYN